MTGINSDTVKSSSEGLRQRRRSSVQVAQAKANLLKLGGRVRSVRTLGDPNYESFRTLIGTSIPEEECLKSLLSPGSYGSDDAVSNKIPHFSSSVIDTKSNGISNEKKSAMEFCSTQVAAVLVGAMLTVIMGIPFAAAYFPIIWESQESANDSAMAFPFPGKIAMGLRMYLFGTGMCQLVLTFTSGFVNAVGLQIVENVAFYHALAYVCFEEQGYGKEALSTLMFMLALTSVLVGIAFYLLGHFKLGSLVYFIPRHVLVGLIGGIGIFIILVGAEVTIDEDVSISVEGLKVIIKHFDLFSIVLILEIILCLLIYLTSKENGEPRFSLLVPMYYCSIPVFFFLGMKVLDVSYDDAVNGGYFFPPLSSDDSSLFDEHTWDIWNALQFSAISWRVVYQCIPTIIGMVAFSLIHVPIYVPALSLSTGQEVDMNNELTAHGYSNILTGLCGGLQNYMSYCNSIAYARLGGEGRLSSLAMTALLALFFFIGPYIIAYIPRCMAGVVLLHLGIELAAEALIDSYQTFDSLEYAGIWFVSAIIALYGMESGLVAGIITALSVYIAQSIQIVKPIKGHVSGLTLRSSNLNFSHAAKQVLDDPIKGRNRIHIIQLRGHLFFGIVTQLTDSIKTILDSQEKVWIVILDFSLVLGMDASAAQAISKIKDILHGDYDISLCIYVTGNNKKFPCKYKIADDLEAMHYHQLGVAKEKRTSTSSLKRNLTTRMFTLPPEVLLHERSTIPADHICDTLDDAFMFAEHVLLAREGLLSDSLMNDLSDNVLSENKLYDSDTIAEEKTVLKQMLRNMLPIDTHDHIIDDLIHLLKRHVCQRNEVLWGQGSKSNSMAFITRGDLVAVQNEGQKEEKTELLNVGAVIGEVGLIQDIDRFNTVVCNIESAVVYILSRDAYQKLKESKPNVASSLQLLVIKNLTHRLQHVSNHIFESGGRDLPV